MAVPNKDDDGFKTNETFPQKLSASKYGTSQFLNKSIKSLKISDPYLR